jgi:hypothetical protein
MKWKYYRNHRLKVSKWVLGMSWVTKFDADLFCHVGRHGVKQGLFYETAFMLRQWLESGLTRAEYQQKYSKPIISENPGLPHERI